MEIVKTSIKDLLILKPKIYRDKRGSFHESFNEKKFQNCGIDFKFVQDNQSYSVKGAIRGLHYQVGKNAQGKLGRAVFGRVLDVAVDIRFGSPTFGKYVAVELSSENNYQFWIPPGFAHGLAVLSEVAVFAYKCTSYYSQADERSIIYNDTQLAIDWQVTSPIVSEKDLSARHFNSIEEDFFF